MKKLLPIVFFTMLYHFSFSQSTTVLSESFETEIFPPQMWTLVSGNDTSWTSVSGGANSTSFSAGVDSGSAALENWLITPMLKPTSTYYQLTFWAYTPHTYAGAKLKIMVSTSGNTISDFDSQALDSLLSAEASTDTSDFTSTWTQHTINLSSYIDSLVYIGFYAKGGGCSIQMDDIEGIPFANDVEVSKVFIQSEPEFNYIGKDIEFSAIITNNSPVETSQTVIFKVNETELSSEEITIEAGESDTVNTTWVGEAGEHTLTVELDEDDITANNSSSETFFVYQEGNLLESFENDFPPAYWTNENNRWQQSTWNETHGDHSALCYYMDAKLTTPKLTIADGDSLRFDAYTQSSHNGYILCSDDIETWDTVFKFSSSTLQTYTVHFTESETPNCIGEKYLAFVASDVQYGTMSLDMVYGPEMAPLTDEFSVLEISENKAAIPRAGNLATYTVVIKNNADVEASKTIFLTANGDTLAQAESKLIGLNETDTVSITWTPDKGYESITLTASVSKDDFLSNNSQSFSTYYYPEEAVDANILIDFESAALPEYWRGSGNYNITDKLYLPWPDVYDGNYALLLHSYNIGTNSITSPPLDLSYNMYKVSFYMYRDDLSDYYDKPDSVNILLNTLPDTTGAILIGSVGRPIVANPVVGQAGWYYYEFELDCSEIEEGFIILEEVTLNSQLNTFIDNFTLTPYPFYDASLTTISTSSDLIWGDTAAFGDLSVTLKNKGEHTIEEATIHWEIDGEPQEPFAWEGSLQSDSTDTVVIANNFPFPINGTDTLEIKTYVEISEDGNSSNDTVNTELITKETRKLPYLNSFETETFADWVNIDGDGDGYTWELSDNNPYHGSMHIRSSSWESGSGTDLIPNNWLVSPGVSIEHSKFYVSYYAGSDDDTYYAESYEVLVSVNGPDTSNFVDIYSETLTAKDYKKVTLEIPGYKGKIAHLAFKHYGSKGQTYLNIDSLSIYYPTIYTLSTEATPEAGGVLSGGGKFIAGDTTTIVAQANKGFEFLYWSSADTVTTMDSTYKVTIREDAVFTAIFDTVEYNITASAGNNGQINPEGEVSVYFDSSITFTITPDNGYQVANIIVDGEEMGAVDTYTFDHVKEDHTIAVTFEVDNSLNITHGNFGQLSIFPNPFSSVIHISAESDIKQAKIINITGQVCLLKEINSQEASIETNLEPGIYIMVLTSASGHTATYKLLRE